MRPSLAAAERLSSHDYKHMTINMLLSCFAIATDHIRLNKNIDGIYCLKNYYLVLTYFRYDAAPNCITMPHL